MSSVDPFDNINNEIDPIEVDETMNKLEEEEDNEFRKEFIKYHKKAQEAKSEPVPIKQTVNLPDDVEIIHEAPTEPPKARLTDNLNTNWKRTAASKKQKKNEKQPVINSDSTVQVEMSKTAPKPISKEKIKGHVEETKNKIIDHIKEVERSGDYLKVNKIEEYYEGSGDRYKEMIGYICNKLFVPNEMYKCFTAANFIKTLIPYEYNPYDSPDVNFTHNMVDMYVYINRLNEIFDYKFLNFDDKNNLPVFSDIDLHIFSFLRDNRSIMTTKLEYMIIQSFLGKFVLSLCTTTDRSFKSNTKIVIDNAFNKGVFNDILQLNAMQDNQKGKTFLSWKYFQEMLFGITDENLLYKFVDYDKLNNNLYAAYGKDYQIECLLANILKTIVPGIALNYFYAIKSVYILGRLLGVYLGKKLYLNKSVEEIMSDLKIIANTSTISYEYKAFMLKQTTRSIPGIETEEEFQKQSQAYFLSHALIGPQYYIIKYIETAFPVLASEIKKIEFSQR